MFDHQDGAAGRHLLDQLGDAVDVMRAVKRAIDPDNLFNPGKIFSQ